MLLDHEGRILSMVNNIGTRILARLQKLSGKSQNGLAKACGVSPSAVSQWISGETKGLKPENLIYASRYLRTTPEWLAVGEGPEDLDEVLGLSRLPPDEQALLKKYDATDDRGRRAIQSVASSQPVQVTGEDESQAEKLA